MSEKKQRTKLTEEQKLTIYNYKMEHPEVSFSVIGHRFSEKFNRYLNKAMVFKWYKLIKEHKEKGMQFDNAKMTRNRLCSTKKLEFERQLYRWC